jgi:hypothetical protein
MSAFMKKEIIIKRHRVQGLGNSSFTNPVGRWQGFWAVFLTAKAQLRSNSLAFQCGPKNTEVLENLDISVHTRTLGAQVSVRK